MSRTPSDESLSVSTEDGEVREGIVSEIIKLFYDSTVRTEYRRVSVKTGLRTIFLYFMPGYTATDQTPTKSN